MMTQVVTSFTPELSTQVERITTLAQKINASIIVQFKQALLGVLDPNTIAITQARYAKNEDPLAQLFPTKEKKKQGKHSKNNEKTETKFPVISRNSNEVQLYPLLYSLDDLKTIDDISLFIHTQGNPYITQILLGILALIENQASIQLLKQQVKNSIYDLLNNESFETLLLEKIQKKDSFRGILLGFSIKDSSGAMNNPIDIEGKWIQGDLKTLKNKIQINTQLLRLVLSGLDLLPEDRVDINLSFKQLPNIAAVCVQTLDTSTSSNGNGVYPTNGIGNGNGFHEDKLLPSKEVIIEQEVAKTETAAQQAFTSLVGYFAQCKFYYNTKEYPIQGFSFDTQSRTLTFSSKFLKYISAQPADFKPQNIRVLNLINNKSFQAYCGGGGNQSKTDLVPTSFFMSKIQNRTQKIVGEETTIESFPSIITTPGFIDRRTDTCKAFGIKFVFEDQSVLTA